MHVGFVVGLDEVDRTRVAEVGGKGANLGELSRLDGVRVPPGFCVATTSADLPAAHMPMTSCPDLLAKEIAAS
ncbi:PEP/pyruvate-binding domain-containing protein [Pseudonocardia pini]|uniref:PEP/pyruvate-binding domain-containing protein n=1 Tax=Pseudonocardia pini TaxID=2758030 RepID=UPI001FE949A8|nr:PEP/pyruvate-binding domain-containing protein [Pseudonocardia pini]